MDNPYKKIESAAAVAVINTKTDALEAAVKEIVELVQDHADMDYRDKEWANMNSEAIINWVIDTRNRLLQIFTEPEP